MLVLVLLVAACEPADPGCWAFGECEGGAECEEDSHCLSGACLDGACAARCESSAECWPGEACVDGLDTRRCRADCGDDRIVDGESAGLVCDGGVVRSCADLADTTPFCSTCGCAAGSVCNSDFCGGTGSLACACVVQQPVGGPCTSDIDCETDNCSTFSGTCRVAAGSPCTESDCDYCHTYGDGSTYCSRQCNGDTDCDGGLCLGFADIDHYVCSPACSGSSDASCSGACRATASGDEYYCDCPRASCQIREEDHAPLAPCAAYGPTHCASGACLGRSICGAIECFTWGYCSDPCTSDADCGAEGVCANVPCEGADTATCGLQCLPRCESDGSCIGRGACSTLDGVAGTVQACFVAPGT